MYYNLHQQSRLSIQFKYDYMLKLAPVFLISTIVLGVFSMTSISVLPKIFLFTSVMLLFLSLLGKKRIA